MISSTAIIAAEQDIVATAMSYTGATEVARTLRQGDFGTEQRATYTKAWDLADEFEDELFQKCAALRKMLKANVKTAKTRGKK